MEGMSPLSSKRAAHRMFFGVTGQKYKNSTEQPGSSRRRVGSVQRDILFLLLKGASLALSTASRQSPRVARIVDGELASIKRRILNQSIEKLYESQLVDVRKGSDGTLTLVLSKEGKRVTLSYDLDRTKISIPARWDGKWRIALFDVPEGKKKIRDALRGHLKRMGFYEFQKSVFVHPYPCMKEIDYLTEFYDARRYLRFITATEIDNELQLKKHFGIDV